MNFNNKVYINPNFNKPSRSYPILNSKMHVNPKFSQQVPPSKSRIYVNPNFVNSSSSFQNGFNSQVVAASLVTNNQIKSNESEVKEITSLTTQSNISTSRYSFVRPKFNQILRSRENLKPKNTVQINKYKSIALSNYKKSFDTNKISQERINATSCFQNTGQKPIPHKEKQTLSQNYDLNQLKLNSGKMFQNSRSYRKFSDLSRTQIKSSNPKMMKRNLQKNNIPCPLFKKYGKCLRNIHGKCDFLHDKKHVSICRKFIKGICHEKDCLLSHDLTSKKMPTCYFYLKGMCTRDSCPYLHVKLNDKTKICPEFSKGYCEKGDKCLNRHIGVSKTLKNAHNSVNRQNVTSRKINKTKSKYTLKAKNVSNTTQKKTKQYADNTIENTSSTESRYYKEITTISEDTNESSKSIKPNRCKLGTLPSFIKL